MIKPTIIIGFLSLAIAFNSNAHDSDELENLKSEIKEIKHRLSELESSPKNSINTPKTVLSPDGWKSVTNWRRLSVGMETSDVRQILGEPHRLDGGTLARWYYENEGEVMFINGKVQQWSEPRN